MGYREDDKFIIYPLYFDKLATKNDGRRIPKKYCIEKPTVADLSKAAKAAGLNPLIENEKAHPLRHWRKEGRILVDKKGSKQELLHQISKFL